MYLCLVMGQGTVDDEAAIENSPISPHPPVNKQENMDKV